MQTSYTRQRAVAPQAGTVLGCSSRVIPRKLGGAVAKVETVTVTSAVNNFNYTLTVAWTHPETGESMSATVSGTSDASATLEEARDLLIAAGNASAEASQHVKFAAHADTDKFTITARRPGDTFTVTAGANLSSSSTTTASSGNTLGFGLMAVAVAGKPHECAPPAAANVTAKVLSWTPVAENNGIYHLRITGDLNFDGVPENYNYVFVGDASATVQEIVEGIIAVTPDRALPANTVALAEDNSKVTVTALIPGIEFEVSGYALGAAGAAPTTAAVTVAVDEAGTPFIPLGPTIHKHTEQNADGTTSYRSGEDVNIHQAGDPILVEVDSNVTTAPAANDPVFFRVSATGTEVLGAFRNSQDAADCVPLPRSRYAWTGKPLRTGQDGKTLAELQPLAA